MAFSLSKTSLVLAASKTMFAIVMARLDLDGEPRAAYEAAQQRVDEMVDRVSGNQQRLQAADIDTRGDTNLAYRSNFDRPEFEGMAVDARIEREEQANVAARSAQGSSQRRGEVPQAPDLGEGRGLCSDQADPQAIRDQVWTS